MNETLEHALQYSERGWRVIPIKPGEKRPPIASWQTAATTNPETIAQWWNGPYRNHGVGIVTGEESELFVLDVDLTEEKDGYHELDRLETLHGPLPAGPRALTGSGGLHIFFHYPAGATIRNDAGNKLGHGIDVRGEGGQVVAAPTIHPNGNVYEWLDGSDETPVPDAPDWLLELLIEPATKTTSQPAPTEDDPDGDYSAAANYNRRTNWHDLLTADEWTYGGQDNNGVHYWTRPGKDVRDGISASIGHGGRDALTVFTTSLQWLPPGTYSRFGYYANRHHNGDRSAAARHLRELDYAPAQAFLDQLPTIEPAKHKPTDDENDPDRQNINRTELAHFIDWTKFWNDDHSEEEWLAYPVIPKGRAIALFAPAKAGKSSLILAIAAAVAAGQPVLGGRPAEQVDVLYLDYEMTQADLYERLTELGYGPEHDLTRLHYALLPSLPPLDTIEGARAVLDLVAVTDAKLVIVDTFGRAVEGDEDSADTVRAFYRHTGLTLKAKGVTYLRTDHAGKDLSRGTRGSSAKNDDVDLVWKLTRTDSRKGTGVTLDRTHSRVSWVPDTVKINRIETDSGHAFVIDGGVRIYPDGTRQIMEELEKHGVTNNDNQRTAWDKARAADLPFKQKQVRDALAMLKERHRLADPLATVKNSHAERHAGKNDRASRDDQKSPTRDQKTPREPRGQESQGEKLHAEHSLESTGSRDAAQPPIRGCDATHHADATELDDLSIF